MSQDHPLCTCRLEARFMACEDFSDDGKRVLSWRVEDCELRRVASDLTEAHARLIAAALNDFWDAHGGACVVHADPTLTQHLDTTAKKR